MQDKGLTKKILSAIFTLILTSAMFLAHTDASFARLSLDKEAESPVIECSPAVLENLEKFVERLGRTADSYASLGITFLECNELRLAEDKFNDAVELAKTDNNRAAELIAEYGLLEIDVLTGKITETEKVALSKELLSAKVPKLKRLWRLGDF